MKLGDPLFTFAEVLEATGTADNWLRTFLARDKDNRLGTKHRTGRLLFSLKDIMAVGLLHRLNVRLGIAPAATWKILDAAEAIFMRALGAGDENVMDVEIRIAFNAAGRVFIWTVEDGVHVTWNDLADEAMAELFMTVSREPHIVVPMSFIHNTTKAHEIAKRWPENAA